MNNETEDYLKQIKIPDYASSLILQTFNIAAQAVTATALKREGAIAYAEYLNRITDMVTVLMNFDDIEFSQKEKLAVMIYAGTALDYKKACAEEIEQAIAALQLPDPHAVKMVGWALEKVPLPNGDKDLNFVTTAWLLNDAENYADYLSDMPDELKAIMKRIHQANYNNAAAANLSSPIYSRLQPAITRILSL